MLKEQVSELPRLQQNGPALEKVKVDVAAVYLEGVAVVVAIT